LIKEQRHIMLTFYNHQKALVRVIRHAVICISIALGPQNMQMPTTTYMQ